MFFIAKGGKCFWSGIQSQITHYHVSLGLSSWDSSSVFDILDIDILKKISHLWNRLSLIWGPPYVSSQRDSGCTFLAGAPRRWYYVLPSTSRHEIQVIDLSDLSLVTLTLITWFRWGLPSLSTLTLLFFSLKSVSIWWGDTLRLYKYTVSRQTFSHHTSTASSCLNQLLLWRLPSVDFLIPLFLLYVVVQILLYDRAFSFPPFIYLFLSVWIYISYFIQ